MAKIVMQENDVQWYEATLTYEEWMQQVIQKLYEYQKIEFGAETPRHSAEMIEGITGLLPRQSWLVGATPEQVVQDIVSMP